MILRGIDKEFSKVRDLVFEMLKEHPQTRNDDKLLFVKCCKELGAKELDDILTIDLSLETVSRTRRKIQNEEGLYLADDVVINSRRKREVAIRDYMRKN